MSRKIDLTQSLSQAAERARDAGPLVEQPQQAPAKQAKRTPARKQGAAPTGKTKTSQSSSKPATTAAAPKMASPSSVPPSEGSAVRRATLIPVELYRTIKKDYARTGTFGQLITWACMDYPSEISDAILQELTGPRRISRVPRTIGTTEGHPETTQIAPRFLPAENGVVTALLEQIKGRLSDTDGADPSKVTRTVLHVEALRAVTRYTNPDQGD